VTSDFKDGHLLFTGDFTSVRGVTTFIDDYTVPGRGHFRETISQKSGDTFIPAGTVDCYRR
jgi:hypothetical protein